jgi:hypothetical protein
MISRAALTQRSHSVFEAELQDVIPICHATIAGTRIIGRLTAGYVLNSCHQGRQISWLFVCTAF